MEKTSITVQIASMGSYSLIGAIAEMFPNATSKEIGKKHTFVFQIAEKLPGLDLPMELLTVCDHFETQCTLRWK